MRFFLWLPHYWSTFFFSFLNFKGRLWTNNSSRILIEEGSKSEEIKRAERFSLRFWLARIILDFMHSGNFHAISSHKIPQRICIRRAEINYFSVLQISLAFLLALLTTQFALLSKLSNYSTLAHSVWKSVKKSRKKSVKDCLGTLYFTLYLNFHAKNWTFNFWRENSKFSYFLHFSWFSWFSSRYTLLVKSKLITILF